MKVLSVVLCGLIFFSGCVTPNGANHLKPEDTAMVLKIDSEPKGALVLLNQDTAFDEKTAVLLGKTPLVRCIQHFGDYTIEITKEGYKPYQTSVSKTKLEVSASLERLYPEGVEPAKVFLDKKADKIICVPYLVRARKATKRDVKTLMATPKDIKHTKAFNNSIDEFLPEIMQNKFSDKFEITKTDFGLAPQETELILDQKEGVRLDKIGYYPEPVMLDLPEQVKATVKDENANYLLLHAESFYTSAGKKFFNAVVPALVAAGAAVGTASAFGVPAHQVNIPHVSGIPNIDFMIIRAALVSGKTHEMLWFGQISIKTNHNNTKVLKKILKKIIRKVPKKFLK